MRFLVLDHFFAQDIESLRRAGDGDEWQILPYELLRSEALRVFPQQVATGLETFTMPALEDARRRYAGILREILEDRFARWPFDAVVMPSDTFFYVRAVPEVAHALGVPLLVAQKETTISEQSLSEHAKQVRRFAPPLADRMTVCSDRHKRFWLRAGGDQDKIDVTGQPRFDFYSDPARFESARNFNGVLAGGGPSVLFLSYATDAYHPDEGRGGGAWDQLHRETEHGLQQLARRGWRVLVKPHPQQPAGSLASWRRRAGDLWGRQVLPIDPGVDVRSLIVGCDVVVGFQSTGLLEAMIAGRPVVYTGWDPQAAGLDELLIPFHRWEREIAVVRAAKDLPEAIAAARGASCSTDLMRDRREIAESYLGPLDGHAAARTVAIMRTEASLWESRRGAHERALRARLAGSRPPLRIARRSRVWARAARRRLGAALGR